MSARALLRPVFGILLLTATASHAATVSFSDTTASVGLNETFKVDLMMDFTGEATVGGGMDIFFDPTALSFSTFAFGSTTLVLDPGLSRSPDLLPGKLEGLGFGNFGGIEGPGVIGTLTFQAIAVGSSSLTLASDQLIVGDFISRSTFASQVVDFGSANVNVQLSAVPVPAAAWLFGSGLIALAGVVKKRKTLICSSPNHPGA